MHGGHQHIAYTGAAFLVAALGAWTALDIHRQVHRHKGAGKAGWILLAATAMGVSIFAMHFLAMLGFEVEEQVRYDPTITAVSLLVAIVGAAGTFSIMQQPGRGRARVYTAALPLGLGIGGLHYIGMMAMYPVRIHYDPAGVLASVAVALISSAVALAAVSRRADAELRLLGAIVLALAICVTHFVAMSAASFEILAPNTPAEGFDRASLAIEVAAGAALLLCLGLFSAEFDRRRQKAGTDALSASSSQLQKVLGGLPLGIAIGRRDGGIVPINPSAHALLGSGAERDGGVDSPALRHARRALDRAAGTDSSATEMLALKNEHGAERFIEISAAPLSEASEEYLLVAQDVTARVAETARYQRLFAEKPGFMAVMSVPDYRFEFVNKSYTLLTGNRPLLGLTVAEALPEVVDQGFVRLLDTVVATRKPYIGKAVPISIGTDERPRFMYLDFIYQPIIEDDGTVSGVISDGYDVTRQKLAQEKAERLQSELIHLSRVSAMGTMASALAHELNQPLAAATSYIRAGVRMLPPELKESEAASVLSAANGQLLRAGEIIRRLRRSLSKGEATRDWLPIDTLFDDSLHLVELAGFARGVDVTVDIDPAAELAYADRIQIEQVLLNLIRNACEAMAASPLKSLRLHAAAVPGGVEVRVEDSGIGFNAQALDSLFSAFSSTTGGMGVGLSICRTIVESHGGKLRVENREGGGAMIAFSLPSPVEDAAETVAEEA